jgi:putative ABC transport system permease protein
MWQDIRYALRGMRKSAGFTVVAVLSLALGIGANAAIFGVFYAVLVRPLPYRDSGRLIQVGRGAPNATDPMVLTPEFVAWRAENHVFDGLTEWNDQQYNLTGAGSPERLRGATVTFDFLTLLGVMPAMGRNFAPEDDRPGAPLTAILTDDLWREHFAGDRGVIGRMVLLNDVPTTIAGVLPAGFRFPGNYQPDVLAPSRDAAQPDFKAQRVGILHSIGRLRPGVTPERAAADLAAVTKRHEAEVPAYMKEEGSIVHAVPLQQQLTGNTRPVLLVLLGAVGLLLLIACVNVASLQLARATVRGREMGLRSALGASRGRLVRLLLVENVTLSLVAGGLGVLLAVWILHLAKLAPGLPWRGADYEVGGAVWGAAFGLSTLAGVLVGLIPGLFAPRMHLSEVLKSGAMAVVGGRGKGMRSLLVVTQVALALTLLLGAGLLVRSLSRVLAVDLGFRPHGVLTAEVRLPQSRYETASARHAFATALIERARSLPGVDAAATANSIPFTNYSAGSKVIVEGQPEAPIEKRPGSAVLMVSPEYFRAMGLRLVRGRGFNDADTATAGSVVIVNAAFAERFFPQGDAIGKYLRTGTGAPAATIVGVVANTRHRGPEVIPEAEIFRPEAQEPSGVIRLVVHTRGDPASLASGVRAAVWAVDKELPVYNVMTMEERISLAGAGRSLQTVLLATFALLALSLAAVGIYGVVAEAVNQRTREIGLRMALGAQAGQVMRMMIERSLLLVVGGVAAGAMAAHYLTQYMKKLLFGVEPTDVVTLAGAAAVLLAVGLIAAYLPARRASRVDPAEALRLE